MMCCSKCKENKPIVNKKYNLCDDCNFMRLHDGKTKAEVYSERAKDKEPKVYIIKSKSTPSRSSKPIKQQTAKEKTRKNELSRVKSEIELDAVQDGKYYCWGCGHAKGGLDKSHILSVKQRKDLELDKENINLFCRDCHTDWESWEIVRMIKLLTFEKDLEYIKSKDKGVYNKILDAIEYWITHDDTFETDPEIFQKVQSIYFKNDFLL